MVNYQDYITVVQLALGVTAINRKRSLPPRKHMWWVFIYMDVWGAIRHCSLLGRKTIYSVRFTFYPCKCLYFSLVRGGASKVCVHKALYLHFIHDSLYYKPKHVPSSRCMSTVCKFKWNKKIRHGRVSLHWFVCFCLCHCVCLCKFLIHFHS